MPLLRRTRVINGGQYSLATDWKKNFTPDNHDSPENIFVITHTNAQPDLGAMTSAHGAAVLIGDPAFEADHERLGLLKTDMGEAWRQLTGLPFVYAAWTGRAGAVTTRDVEALVSAQADGLAHIPDIAAEYAPSDPVRQAKAARYLRDNVRYALGEPERRGLQLFLDHAADLGLGPRRTVSFF